MSEWLKRSLEEAKSNFDSLPEWAKHGVRRKHDLLESHSPFHVREMANPPEPRSSQTVDGDDLAT